MDLLPKEIVPTVLCYTICSDHEDVENLNGHRRVDIAICNANGYLLEFCNKRITNSCYVTIEDAAKLQVYYHFTDDTYGVYYLLRNEYGVMVVVKKWKDTLMVMGCYNNIKSWKVFDFKSKGYPQLGVYYFDSDTVNIMSFSEFDRYKLGIDNHFAVNGSNINNSTNISVMNTEEDDLSKLLAESDVEMTSHNQNENIVGFLKKKLQAMEHYNNELKYEVYKMNQLLRRSCKNSSNASYIQFTKSWSRIHLGYWILGVEFWSSGIGDVSKIKLVTFGRDFTSYTHRFFSLSDKIDSDAYGEGFEEGNKGKHDVPETFDHSEKMEVGSRKAPCEFPTLEKCVAVVAFRVPDFGQRTTLTVSLRFIHDGQQFRTGTFHLKPEHFFQEKYQVFHAKDEISFTEDLMSCLAVRKEMGLTVEMKYNLGIRLENVLTERLGFTKREIVGENYFTKESGDLCGTCLSVERMPIDLVSWNLRISVTSLNILRIFIGALYNELPMPVRIQLD